MFLYEEQSVEITRRTIEDLMIELSFLLILLSGYRRARRVEIRLD